MDSGVAKVNPGSPSVSSDQVCKICPFQKHLSPGGVQLSIEPSGGGGNLSDVDWYLLGKNNAPKMPLTEHKLGHILHP